MPIIAYPRDESFLQRVPFEVEVDPKLLQLDDAGAQTDATYPQPRLEVGSQIAGISGEAEGFLSSVS